MARCEEAGARLLHTAQPGKYTNICLTFVQRRPNVFDIGPTLYKCYTNVLCVLGREALKFHNYGMSSDMSTAVLFFHSWFSEVKNICETDKGDRGL